MKGLELPINMIVVVAIAVLVLVVVAAFLTGSFFRDTGTIQLQQAFSSACGTLKNAYNCQDTSFVVEGAQIPGQSGSPTFAQLCDAVYSSTPIAARPNQCLRACGCPTT